MTLNPPAFVLALPPILQDPLLPISSGNVIPCSCALASKFSKIHPAWQVTISKDRHEFCKISLFSKIKYHYLNIHQ